MHLFLLVGWLFKLNCAKDLMCTHPSLDTRNCSFRRNGTNVTWPRKILVSISHDTIPRTQCHCVWLLDPPLSLYFFMQLRLIFYHGIKKFSINHIFPNLCIANSCRDLFDYFNLTCKSYSFLLLHPKICWYS